MVGDFAGALVDRPGIESLDRVGDARVQLFVARDRNASKQRLPHEFMCEGEGRLGSFGARNDYSHMLGFLDDGEEFVNVDLGDGT